MHLPKGPPWRHHEVLSGFIVFAAIRMPAAGAMVRTLRLWVAGLGVKPSGREARLIAACSRRLNCEFAKLAAVCPGAFA